MSDLVLGQRGGDDRVTALVLDHKINYNPFQLDVYSMQSQSNKKRSYYKCRQYDYHTDDTDRKDDVNHSDDVHHSGNTDCTNAVIRCTSYTGRQS